MTGVTIRTPIAHARLTLVPAPALAPADATRVDRIWREAVAARPTLFDGAIVSVASASEEGITGWVTGYRTFLAQRREPDLFPRLRVRPLAVSGILRCADGLVVGRRAEATEQDRGCWELVPAGGVEPPRGSGGTLDLAGQLLRELDEEVGLRPGDLEGTPRPWGILDDTTAHVVDVVFTLHTRLEREAVCAAFVASPREYDALAFLPIREAGLADGALRFSTATAALIRAGSLLDERMPT